MSENVDFKAIIDFNKFTLALATGGLIYTFERIPEFKDGFPVFILLFLLALFFFSTVLGIALYAAATKSLHQDGKKKRNLDKAIEHLGSWHSGLLFAAVILLGITMLIHTLSELKADTEKPNCSCCECGCQANGTK